MNARPFEPLFLSIRETAAVLGISRTLVSDLIAQGRIPAVSPEIVGTNRKLVPRCWIDELVAATAAQVPMSAFAPPAPASAVSAVGGANGGVGVHRTRRAAEGDAAEGEGLVPELQGPASPAATRSSGRRSASGKHEGPGSHPRALRTPAAG